MEPTNDEPLSEMDANASDDESVVVGDEIEDTNPEEEDDHEGEQPDEEDEEEQEDDVGDDDDDGESKQEEEDEVEDDSEMQFKPQNPPANIHPMMDSIPIPEPPQIQTVMGMNIMTKTSHMKNSTMKSGIAI